MNAKSNLQPDNPFAIGDILRAEIIASSDGTPYRTHRYAADISAWLCPLLLRGRSGRVHDVGSMGSLSILALAQRVAQVLSAKVGVRALRTAPKMHVPQHYVPSTQRAHEELGLRPSLGLDESLKRTARWHGHAEGSAGGMV